MAWTIENVKQSYSCNQAVLKFLRERRGWTQFEFANIAGYSERLISKAESGRSISSQTVLNLADALSVDDDPVYPEDLICDPLQCAKNYVAAVYVHQVEAIEVIRHFLDDDVVFQIAGEPEQIPFAGRYEGISGVQTFIERFFSILQVPENHDHTPCYQYISQGNQVVIWGESWMHPIGHPIEKPIPTTNLLKFKRGKIIYLDDRFDTRVGADLLSPNQRS